jgi:NAD(P)-dependent dehydrogenase (short-subunit alcohol dehydrogenase family)
MTTVTPLEGRVVVLTGAAGLLGRRHARTLVDAGASVSLVDIDANGLAATARELAGARAVAIEADITSASAVAAMVARTLDAFGRVDVLVNNAAIDPKFDRGLVDGRAVNSVGFENFPLDAWNASMAVNVTGMFLCTQAVARPMLAQGSGNIINVSSIYGMVGPDQRLYQEPGGAPLFKPVTYSVSKSAVYGLTKYLAAYWAGQNIRVNALTLGGVEHDQDAGFVTRYSARTPLGRMARPDEYGGALIFLASDASSYMTGSNLVVDGGWTAW